MGGVAAPRCTARCTLCRQDHWPHERASFCQRPRSAKRGCFPWNELPRQTTAGTVHVVSTVTEPGTEIRSQSVESWTERSTDTVPNRSTPWPRRSFQPRSTQIPDWIGHPTYLRKTCSARRGGRGPIQGRTSGMLPMLRTINANKSGTYFSRMITWPGKRRAA